MRRNVQQERASLSLRLFGIRSSAGSSGESQPPRDCSRFGRVALRCLTWNREVSNFATLPLSASRMIGIHHDRPIDCSPAHRIDGEIGP